MLQDDFIKLAHEIDDTEDRLNDALEEDRFDDAAKLSMEKQQKVYALTQIYAKMVESGEGENLQTFTDYLTQLMQAEMEQLELLREERERVRKEIISFNKGNSGKSSYQQVNSLRSDMDLSERLKVNRQS